MQDSAAESNETRQIQIDLFRSLILS
jgi:hypothetical protein